ncbi:hypothetical protein [Luteimonas sp. 3794]|uniref:hypothetical protein n=1 Tax=Luteimonas sp. 3794 TaxID=2817730 RepID=UPI00285ECF99|nr:hypothetical protein [Luteimonas sp. 3794]MDR6992661.1 hypothetical protein [Luteimonas sp. 3794]
MPRFRVNSPRHWATAAVWLVLLCVPFGAVAADIADRIGVPGPIRFDDTEFALQWTSNPSAELYKQEYVPAGQRVQRYDSMVVIDVRPLGADVAQTVRAMIELINARKATDPVANFDLLVNEAGDEVLLDFLMSAPDASGIVVEWNAYRYFRGPDGQGTTMVGISRRAYGDAARDFVADLKARRVQDIETLAALAPFEIRLQLR